MNYVFPPPLLGLLVLSKYQAEHITGQCGLLILYAPCCIEVSWLSTVLNMFKDIPHQFPIIKDLRYISILKGLLSLHFTFWLLRDMLCRYGFSPSVYQAWQG